MAYNLKSGLGIGPVAYNPKATALVLRKAGTGLTAGGVAAYRTADGMLGQSFLEDLQNVAASFFSTTPQGQQIVAAVQPSLVATGVKTFGQNVANSISASPLLWAAGGLGVLLLIGRGLR